MFPLAQRGKVVRTCRACSCDDNHACVTELGPCCWILLDVDTPTGVCSACAVELEWDQEGLAFAGRDRDGIPLVLKQPRRLVG
jgi:hypothetical protein